jgi:hypothetical protein
MPPEDPPAGNGANNVEHFPPVFNEEWTMPRNGRRRPTVDRGTNDFPDVGEMPIPNVSPMTAHVSPWDTLLMRSTTSPFFDIFAASSLQSSPRARTPMRKLDWFSNSWYAQNHDTFVISRF